MNTIIYTYRVWQRQLKVFYKLYKSSIALNFIEPLLYLSAMGVGLGGFVNEINGMPYIYFIAPGFIASNAMMAATYESTYNVYVRMAYQKTYNAILATPINLKGIVLGEIVWAATKSLLYSSVIMFTVGALGLVSFPHVLLGMPFLFLTGLIFAQLGIICVAVMPNITYLSYYFTILITPLFLLSEIFFPLDNMPVILQKAAGFTPLYHMVALSRSFAGGNFDAIWTHMVYIVVMALVLLPLSVHLMSRKIIKSL